MPGTSWFDVAKYAARARTDFSINVTHWTRATADQTAFDVLKRILNERLIRASTSGSGFIKANQRATCFTETPVSVMSRLFRVIDHDRDAKGFVKWEPYGISFLKPVLYQTFGGRPVLYLNDEEYHELLVTSNRVSKFAWRVVHFDQQNLNETIDWSHEREWRVPGDVELEKAPVGARAFVVVSRLAEKDELAAAYPPGENALIKGIISLQELMWLGY